MVSGVDFGCTTTIQLIIECTSTSIVLMNSIFILTSQITVFLTGPGFKQLNLFHILIRLYSLHSNEMTAKGVLIQLASDNLLSSSHNVPGCSSCTSLDDCSACTGATYLNNLTNMCVSECPEGMFESPTIPNFCD